MEFIFVVFCVFAKLFIIDWVAYDCWLYIAMTKHELNLFSIDNYIIGCIYIQLNVCTANVTWMGVCVCVYVCAHDFFDSCDMSI